jgi:hypothetical protein
MYQSAYQPVMYQVSVPPTVHAPIIDNKTIHEEIEELREKARQHTELIHKLMTEINEIKEQLNK